MPFPKRPEDLRALTLRTAIGALAIVAGTGLITAVVLAHDRLGALPVWLLPLAASIVVFATSRLWRRSKGMRSLEQELIGVAAYNLRTPLSRIKFAADSLVQTSIYIPPENREDVANLSRQILDDANHLIAMTAALAEPSDANKRAPAEMTDTALALREVIDTFKYSMQSKGIAFAADIADNLPRIAIDKHFLVTVLDTMLGSAQTYTPRDGRIRLSAKTNGGRVVFSVADSGSGVLRKSVYDNFKKAAPERGDTGLGRALAVAKDIIQGHGGLIWTEASPDGKESALSFSLPVA